MSAQEGATMVTGRPPHGQIAKQQLIGGRIYFYSWCDRHVHHNGDGTQEAPQCRKAGARTPCLSAEQEAAPGCDFQNQRPPGKSHILKVPQQRYSAPPKEQMFKHLCLWGNISHPNGKEMFPSRLTVFLITYLWEQCPGCDESRGTEFWASSWLMSLLTGKYASSFQT